MEHQPIPFQTMLNAYGMMGQPGGNYMMPPYMQGMMPGTKIPYPQNPHFNPSLPSMQRPTQQTMPDPQSQFSYPGFSRGMAPNMTMPNFPMSELPQMGRPETNPSLPINTPRPFYEFNGQMQTYLQQYEAPQSISDPVHPNMVIPTRPIPQHPRAVSVVRPSPGKLSPTGNSPEKLNDLIKAAVGENKGLKPPIPQWNTQNQFVEDPNEGKNDHGNVVKLSMSPQKNNPKIGRAHV